MSREVDNPAPDDNLTSWMTESRQQYQEDQKVPRGTRQDVCFATLPLGGQDHLRAKMKAEMNKDYNDFLSKQKTRRANTNSSSAPNLLPPSKLPIPMNSCLQRGSADERDREEPVRRRGEGMEQERGDYRDHESYRREHLGPPPLAPRYDPLEELRIRRYFEDQLYAGPRGYPPQRQDYTYNPYVNYYQQMDRVWGPNRDISRSPPRMEKRVTFPHEWPEESDLYGWARQGRRSEMQLRDVEREGYSVERRGRSESPLNRSRSAPPDKKERTTGGFMDGFGSGDRGRDELRRKRKDYAKELKEQIRSKQIIHSVGMENKRVSRSRPPTPPSHTQLYESPPAKQQQAISRTDPLEYYKSNVQPDHYTHIEEEVTPTRLEKTQDHKQSYRQELEQQIEDVKHRKEQRAREIKKSREEPVEEWSPWGKGGGGAPLKDNSGRVVADLKVLNKAYQVREKTGSSPKLEELADICVLKTSHSPLQKTNQTHAPSDPFSTPSPSKKESTLTPQQEYREYLRQQVEEKKARKLAEEARKREEDQKEVDRLEKERIKLQEDYQREVAKQREKEEAIRKKNDELKLAAEQRRNAPSPPQRGRVRERRRSSPPDNTSVPVHTQQPRDYSPPVPAIRNKHRFEHYASENREISPPVPALRRLTGDLSPPHQTSDPISPHNSPIKNNDTIKLIHTLSPINTHKNYVLPDADSAAEPIGNEDSKSDVVKQLTDMKLQLRCEKDRVKEQLERSRDTYQSMTNLISSIHVNNNISSHLPAPKISSSAKPPFKIRKSVIPVKLQSEDHDTSNKMLSVHGERKEERRTVGFHLQNTQPKSKAYHREYTPLLKGRGTPPTQNRPDSTGSTISISTLEIEALALKNDNRMKRLESLLKSNQEMETRKTSPESIINQLLNRAPARRNNPPSHHPRHEDFSL
ncbi:hypothetical protein LOD99_7697 [Oopsacas minuta]|uniref:CCDC66 domain-containing protein n=1 Tax=Oopsacas minuta TaxID=111878 RepID=A0AAV7JPA0_9METZ|nr:hypothetical protein LOD99_7697 [Oopsacas minuta]